MIEIKFSQMRCESQVSCPQQEHNTRPTFIHSLPRAMENVKVKNQFCNQSLLLGYQVYLSFT